MAKKKDDDATAEEVKKLSRMAQLRLGVNKTYSAEVVRNDPPPPLRRLHTGIDALDVVTGGGGIAVGTWVELQGDPSGGKSTALATMIASGQRRCANCYRAMTDSALARWRLVWDARWAIDPETAEPPDDAELPEDQKYCDCGAFKPFVAGLIHVEDEFDPHWYEAAGVDLRRVMLARPSHAQMACDVGKAMIESRFMDLLALDSTGALQAMQESTRSAEDPTRGVGANALAQLLRYWSAASIDASTEVYANGQRRIAAQNPHWTTKVFISQMRVDQKSGYQMATGGNAPKFYATTRFHFSAKTRDEKREMAAGQGKEEIALVRFSETTIRTLKNKAGPRGTCTLEFGLVDDEDYQMAHYDSRGFILGMMRKLGLVDDSGSGKNKYRWRDQGFGNLLDLQDAIFLDRRTLDGVVEELGRLYVQQFAKLGPIKKAKGEDE